MHTHKSTHTYARRECLRKGNQQLIDQARQDLKNHKLHYQEEVRAALRAQQDSSSYDSDFILTSVDYTDTYWLPHLVPPPKDAPPNSGLAVKIFTAIHWMDGKPHTVVYLHSEHQNPKGPNSVTTAHYHMLRDLLTRASLGRPRPRRWILQSDGGSENVQKISLSALATFAAKGGWFQEVQLSRLVPNHTKNLNDQVCANVNRKLRLFICGRPCIFNLRSLHAYY